MWCCHLDNDEPLLSGSGIVSKDITDENLLDSWHNVLKRWHQNVRQRPRQVRSLVRKGIPEPLRDEVWQLLAGCTESPDLLEAYRTLIPQVSVDFLNLHSQTDLDDDQHITEASPMYRCHIAVNLCHGFLLLKFCVN